ncbi:MAG: hypothetical protein K2O12_06500, partial [Muribaculaceae bacterium]|nr:hypothetical protein [Muribaculaceae bacterium]
FGSRKTRALSGKRSKVLVLNGLFGGVVIPVDKPAGMLVSWEIGVADLLGYSVRTSARGPWLSAGIGLAYRWFNVGDGYGLVREDDRMVLRPLPEMGSGMCDPKSRFTTSSFLLTFSMKQSLYKRWAFMLSAVLDFNFYTDGFFQYSTDASRPVRTRIHYKDFRQRVMRCDVMATVGLSGIAGAYVRYSPSALFKGDHGPGFEQIAAGVSFFF